MTTAWTPKAGTTQSIVGAELRLRRCVNTSCATTVAVLTTTASIIRACVTQSGTPTAVHDDGRANYVVTDSETMLTTAATVYRRPYITSRRHACDMDRHGTTMTTRNETTSSTALTTTMTVMVTASRRQQQDCYGTDDHDDHADTNARQTLDDCNVAVVMTTWRRQILSGANNGVDDVLRIRRRRRRPSLARSLLRGGGDEDDEVDDDHDVDGDARGVQHYDVHGHDGEDGRFYADSPRRRGRSLSLSLAHFWRRRRRRRMTSTIPRPDDAEQPTGPATSSAGGI